jgi:hypothetical protein
MPCAAEPTPYVNNTTIKQDDYFGHQVVSSPLARQRLDRATDASSLTHRSITIPRKPVGSPSRQRNAESSDTIVHNHSSIDPMLIQPISPHRVQQPQTSCVADPALATFEHSKDPAPSEQQYPFLGNEALSPEPARPGARKATAISFQPVSTKQVEICPPFVQNLTVHRIISLNELPPVSLKDPISARIPSSCRVPKGPLPIWAPLTIIKTEMDKPPSCINTSTIITTGCVPLQPRPGQLEAGSNIQIDTPLRGQPLQHKHKPSQIPLRTSSHQRSKQREMPAVVSQTHPAGIVISSERHLNLTKQRSIRLCQISSPDGDRAERKSTPISISTSPQSPVKQKEAAQNAALLAFHHLRHQTALKKAAGQTREQLTPPKIRKQKREDTRETNANRTARGENGDVGDPSKIKRGPEKGSKATQTSAVAAARTASRIGASDSDTLAVWHAEPSAEKKVGKGERDIAQRAAHMKALALYQKCGVPPTKRLPRPGRPTRSIRQVAIGMAQSAWLLVEPVFDTDSPIRKRLERQRLTWQDVGVFVAAVVFMAGTFLASVAFARVAGIGLQVVRAFGVVFRFLTGV